MTILLFFCVYISSLFKYCYSLQSFCNRRYSCRSIYLESNQRYIAQGYLNCNQYQSIRLQLSTSERDIEIIPNSDDIIVPAKREYIPRKTSLPTPSNPIVSSVGPRIYKPKVSNSNTNYKSYSPGSQQSNPDYKSYSSPSQKSSPANSYSNDGPMRQPRSENYQLLTDPFLLIRYRIPREKTEFKIQLEEAQKAFIEQNKQSREQYESGYRGGGGGGGGGRDSFFDNFAPPTTTNFDQRKSQQRNKNTGKEKDQNNEFERPSKGSAGRRSVDDDDDELDDAEVSDIEESSFGVSDEEYYGDESNLGLSSISANTLQTMETEGFTLEEMQMALYGEYGIKVSMGALKKRLIDDKSLRKGKKRTGKTRREKNKARNLKFNPIKETKIDLSEYSSIQVQELAGLIDVGSGELIKYLMLNLGKMATMTQSIDIATAKLLVIAFGKQLKDDQAEEDDNEDDTDNDTSNIDPNELDSLNVRAPIVTIMGHVDHGKTSLLDQIRMSNVAKGEAGGITQGISAFNVKTKDDKFITFIDTPGHAAFGEMRKRGANVTDIVVLVVAADDGIMEQTKECIAAAKAANCPIVVAINKIDKEGADPDRIKSDLMSFGVLVEEFGGESQCVEVSAKKAIGLDNLLDKLLLQAEVLNLKSFEDVPVQGTVLEARVDKGLGVVATALVQKGTLKVGDLLLCGPAWGRVRRLINDQGKEIKSAGPSTPVQIVGLSNVPNAGDSFALSYNEADTREVAEARQRIVKQAVGSASTAAIIAQAMGFAGGSMETREILKVPLLIKADVAGSVEALRSSLEALEQSDESSICKVDIVYSGVGDITSSDVAIAQVSKAKIVAFNVAAGFNAMEDARSVNVEIGYYDVVYKLLEELEKTVKKTLAPPPPGKLVGKAEIKKVFKIGKSGKVAGCLVTEGLMTSGSNVRILRGKRNPVYTGTISSLKVVKETVQEVPEGSECGISFTDFLEFEEGDIIECFSSNSSEDET